MPVPRVRTGRMHERGDVGSRRAAISAATEEGRGALLPFRPATEEGRRAERERRGPPRGSVSST